MNKELNDFKKSALYKRTQKQHKKSLAVNIPKTFEEIDGQLWKLKSGIESQYLRDDRLMDEKFEDYIKRKNKKPLNERLNDMSLFFGLFQSIDTSLTVMKKEIERFNKNV